MRTLLALGSLLILGAIVWLGFGTGSMAPGLSLAGLSVICLLAAAIGTMARFMRSSHADESDLGPAEVRLLVQSMASMATADGTVAPAEIDAFSRIYSRATGLTIDRDDIARIVTGFKPDFDIADRLRRNRPILSPEYRRLILHSCEQVMVSDEIAQKAEQTKLEEIRQALGLSASMDTGPSSDG